ncbi:MAG: CHC2 zinc finger domain-containing protein [Nitrospirota bacterium]
MNETLTKPDIVEIIQQHIDLKQKGGRYWGICLFHDEKTPSFMVDAQKQTFMCFGCGAGGDVVTFIQKLHGVNFRRALTLLGISGQPYRPNPELQKQKELIKDYRQRLRAYEDKLCDYLRTGNECKLHIRTMDDVEAMASFYHQEAYIEHLLDCLQFGSEEERFEIYTRGGMLERATV